MRNASLEKSILIGMGLGRYYYSAAKGRWRSFGLCVVSLLALVFTCLCQTGCGVPNDSGGTPTPVSSTPTASPTPDPNSTPTAVPACRCTYEGCAALVMRLVDAERELMNDILKLHQYYQVEIGSGERSDELFDLAEEHNQDELEVYDKMISDIQRQCASTVIYDANKRPKLAPEISIAGKETGPASSAVTSWKSAEIQEMTRKVNEFKEATRRKGDVMQILYAHGMNRVSVTGAEGIGLAGNLVLPRASFVEKTYEAVYNNGVCRWLVLDVSCYAYPTCEKMQSLNMPQCQVAPFDLASAVCASNAENVALKGTEMMKQLSRNLRLVTEIGASIVSEQGSQNIHEAGASDPPQNTDSPPPISIRGRGMPPPYGACSGYNCGDGAR